MRLKEKLTSILAVIESQSYYESSVIPTDALIQLRNEAEVAQDALIAEIAQWEIYACTTYPQDVTRRILKRHRTAELVDTWSKEQIQYYLKRFRECAQVQLKCNYGELILDCRGRGRLEGKERFETFKALVPLLIRRGQLDLENYGKGFRFHSIAGALEWSLLFSNTKYIEVCIKKLVSLIRTVGQKYDYKEILELVDILLTVQKSSRFKHLLIPYRDTIIIELHKAKGAFESKNDLLFLGDVLDKIITCYRAFGYSEEEIRKMTTEKVQVLICRAELDDSYTVKGLLYDDAIKLLVSIGETSQLNELQTKKREYLRIAERDEMKHISVPFTFPEEMEKYFAFYGALPDLKSIISLMVNDSNLVPDAEQVPEISPLSLMARIFVYDGRVVGRTSSTEENIESLKNQDYLLELQLVAFMTGRIMDMALAKGLEGETLLSLYSSWEFCNQHRKQILENGYDKYAKRDYIAAVHILAPQFEACLREMFEAIGIRSVTQGDGIDKEQVLNEFLKRPEVRKQLGERFARYIEMVLVAPEGWNIRNDIAHGILSPSVFSHERASVLVHLYLRLFRFRKNQANARDTKEENCK